MLIILFVIVVHKILYAKGPVATAHTYPYQPNGHGFKGAIAKVTLLALQKTTPERNADRLPVPGVLRELTQLLALQTTPDLNAELRPMPGVWWGYRMGGGGVSINVFWWGYRVEGGCVCQLQRFLNSTASQPSIIYVNYSICDCSTQNTICQGTCCYCTYLPLST